MGDIVFIGMGWDLKRFFNNVGNLEEEPLVLEHLCMYVCNCVFTFNVPKKWMVGDSYFIAVNL